MLNLYLSRLLLLLFSIVSVSAVANTTVDSLLSVLDHDISIAQTYEQIKKSRINKLKEKLQTTAPESLERYQLNDELLQEYRTYSTDSSFSYINKNIELARILGYTEQEQKKQLELAYLLSSVGMYLEANDVISRLTINNSTHNDLLSYYYTCQEHLYSEAASAQPKYKQLASRYRRKRNSYRDSMLMSLDTISDTYLWLRETMLTESNNLDSALVLNDLRMQATSFGTQPYAVVTYQRAQIYQRMGDTNEYLRYLILSAISDVRSSNKDQSSLMVLAQELDSFGDFRRAYRYINYSWEISKFYNTRMRSWKNASPLSIINGNYNSIINGQNRRLIIYITLVILLAILLIIALFFIYRQMKTLAAARQELIVANNRLKSLNGELEDLNKDLRSANMKLSESNLIKETYIGRFFKLCSTYVDRLQANRKFVNKKLRCGQINELLKLTQAENSTTEDLQELYSNFDSAFLHLFPNFVESVNNLLLPEEQFDLKPGELLNTELRILAMIRLGIKDSSQIAESLHYSVNTIYNYRSKLKAKACVSREDFEKMVSKIR